MFRLYILLVLSTMFIVTHDYIRSWPCESKYTYQVWSFVLLTSSVDQPMGAPDSCHHTIIHLCHAHTLMTH